MSQVWPWPSRSLLIDVELARELRRWDGGGRVEVGTHQPLAPILEAWVIV